MLFRRTLHLLLLPAALFLTFDLHAAEPDADHDGVADAVDRCPDTPQLKKIDPNSRIAPLFEPEYKSDKPVSVAVDGAGCPRDTDGDGVADHLDFCPEDTREEVSAGVTVNGCPRQSDGDGTPDYRDKCPDTPRGIKSDRDGCPLG